MLRNNYQGPKNVLPTLFSARTIFLSQNQVGSACCSSKCRRKIWHHMGKCKWCYVQLVLKMLFLSRNFLPPTSYFTVHQALYVKVKRPYVESTPITRIGISNVPKTKSPTPGGMFASLIGKANRLARMMLKENEAKTAAKKEKKRNEISFIIGSRVADFVKVGETWLFSLKKIRNIQQLKEIFP